MRNYRVYFLTIIASVVFYSLYSLNKNRIKIDATSYYMYLPAILTHQDLSLNYLDSNSDYYKDLTWYNTTNKGERIIKHTSGVSLLLLPFFLLANGVNSVLDFGDEFSLLHQNIMHTGVLIYFFIGIFYLRKTLFELFNKATSVELTLLFIVLGTNLFWYLTNEPFMSHALTFSVVCMSQYFFFKWRNENKLLDLYMFFGLLGIIFL